MTANTPKRFINRELSWLDFNARVLGEAQDRSIPILDRLKFAAIFSSNLDEFFMVRVAGLRQQLESGSAGTDPAGLRVAEQLARIRARVLELTRRQSRCLSQDLVPALSRAGVRLLTLAQLSPSARERLDRFFERNVLPVLTPVAVDPSHPFPIIANGALEIAVTLRRARSEGLLRALVEVPKVLPRFVRAEGDDRSDSGAYVLLEDLVLANLRLLFVQCRVVSSLVFRIIRDMDFSADDEGVADLLLHLEKELRRRRQREPVRLELATGGDRRLARWLVARLGLDPDGVYWLPAPLDRARFFELIEKESRPALVEPPWPPLEVPGIGPGESVFEAIRRESVIPLFHPFERFDPVTRFLEEAAGDPAVLAIKQTLYRVSGDSPVVHALQRAAVNGKQVTVIVEVKARFDEERNIAWARSLEEAGVHVIYGIVGMKIHCKALLVIRREEGRIARYLHLSTGNYNDRTARIYADTGLLVNDADLCMDVAALFNVMTGYSEPPLWRRLAVGPFNLRQTFLSLIDREARVSTRHQPGHIIAKLNSLADPEIIDHLYDAAAAGVRVDLICRGICCLDPATCPERIRVVSIVDRYLEHSRVYYFANGGQPEYYLSSADWMQRNLNRRVEIVFPVEDPRTRQLLDRMLQLQLQDDYKGRELRPGGRYVRRRRADAATRSQRRTYEMFAQRLAESRASSGTGTTEGLKLIKGPSPR